MRISFVGKGGSGKTTLASLLAQYTNQYFEGNTYVIDADLNMHLASQLDLRQESTLKYLSDSTAQENIKQYLIGNNKRISSTGHFKKTTTPSLGSNIIDLSDKANYIYKNYAVSKNNKLFLSIVGTYLAEKIGRSCYHDSLSILENILTHTRDKGAILIADMVAGVDAFANTLHTQFDVLVFCVEPTKKSIEVFQQYESLAHEANVENNLFVIINKARNKTDLEFVTKYIDKAKIIGVITDSAHIRDVDKEITNLDINKIEKKNLYVIKKTFEILKMHVVDPNDRLRKIQQLHVDYVQQGYVKDRFGDLSGQIDLDFKL